MSPAHVMEGRAFSPEKAARLLSNGIGEISRAGVDEHCAAVVEAWFPGEEGGNAIADILFGAAVPTGKLSAGFPDTVGEVPVHYSRKGLEFRGCVDDPKAKATARYPFGHGLSYTTFELGRLTVAPEEIKAGEAVTVTADLANTGRRDGAEVVQLYVGHRACGLARPVMELKGFAKIPLAAGAKAGVEFTLDTEVLAFTNAEGELVIDPGRYEVMVGFSSEDIRAKAAFEITGEAKVIENRTKFFSALSLK